ncbi:ZIP family metal transporter [Christensenellaceae bacterium OttesenSCG-928-K19]|nr:ZIP family metal transporter [Christensenellaceae bacterium OttesenSCG-928-K19]
MNSIVFAILIALLVGAGGTGGGAALTFLFKKTGKMLSAMLMGIAGGIMLATVAFDMIHEALEAAGLIPALIGLAVGALALFVVTKLIPHKDADELNEADLNELKKDNLVRSGLLLAVGIAIHNLPQGIAIGSGLSSGLGFTLSLLLLLHNIPEGMAMAIPLKVGNVGHGKILWIALMATLPTIIGAVIGAAVAGISETFIGAAIAFAGGAMLYLTLHELIPQALDMHKSARTVLSVLLGVAIGGIVIWLTHRH